MTKTELNELIHENRMPCVSIIAPTHRLSPDRIKDPEIVSRDIEAAKLLLKKNCQNPNDCLSISEKIDSLNELIDFVHPKDGIGIFVSPGLSKLIRFPFPVSNKVRTGDSFCLKDLIFHFNNAVDYYILDISKKKVRLFKAQGEESVEIINEDFPFIYEEEFEYARTSRGNSYSNTLKSYERDKSVLQEIRLKDFLRHTDHLLDKYININIPLVVGGGKKEQSDFFKITNHENNVIGKVNGSYNFNGENLLARHAWKEVQNYIKDQNKILVQDIIEKIGMKLAVSGLTDVWKAAMEAKGLELVVEKDFESHGYISKNELYLKLNKPFGNTEYVFESDVVDKLIRIVLEKGGKITFVEKDELKDFNNIALLLRYHDN